MHKYTNPKHKYSTNFDIDLFMSTLYLVTMLWTQNFQATFWNEMKQEMISEMIYEMTF